MEHETLSLANTESVTVIHPTDEKKRVIFTGAERLFLQDSDKGAVVQGVKKDGRATIFRFRDVKADDLLIEAVLSDPLLPAGIYGPAMTEATLTEPMPVVATK